MSELITLAGIAWDPQIRGILTVATGAVVLMGSVWLIVSTNSGTRLGTLISVAGFFGWMTILAVTWWIYGTGWRGESPSWQVIDINVGDLQLSGLPEARLLPNPDELATGYQLVISSGNPRLKQNTIRFQARQITQIYLKKTLQHSKSQFSCEMRL